MENDNPTPQQNPQPAQAAPASRQTAQIAGAIIIAGLIIAGSILLKGSVSDRAAEQAAEQKAATTETPPAVGLAPVTSDDRSLGDPNAPVTVVEYADFQCPFCGRLFTAVEPTLRSQYINTGKVRFVYRDYAFLGPESTRAAEAALCANEQGKFWDYHDYLFSHQAGENQGAFSDPNLEKFAATLGLNTTAFNQCFESGKYASAITDSTQGGTQAGVTGTPKGFILKGTTVVDTIDGAEPLATVTAKIAKALATK